MKTALDRSPSCRHVFPASRGLRRDAAVGGDDALSRSLALYQDTYLPEDILTKVDRASMACGLEVRAPFLDAELVDVMQRLPASFKPARNQTKRLLKRAAASRLPPSILARPKKGFGIPIAQWLRGPLAPLVDQLLGRDRLERQGTFRPEEVARRIAEHRAGVRDHRKPLWTLLDVPALARSLAGLSQSESHGGTPSPYCRRPRLPFACLGSGRGF